ncbi:MAG: hypothetical protein ABSF53_06120, partial [Terracidiphilus sp.]
MSLLHRHVLPLVFGSLCAAPGMARSAPDAEVSISSAPTPQVFAPSVVESKRPNLPLEFRPKQGESFPGIVSNLWRVDRIGTGWSMRPATGCGESCWPIAL